MEEDYSMDTQEAAMSEMANRSMEVENSGEQKDFAEGYEESYEDDDGSGNFRNNRGRGNFRNRGGRPPPAWMNGPPMRFRGRGYGPAGPPMRARGFFRGRGSPRFTPNNGPSYDNNWGPMGPPPGMIGGPPPFGPPPGMMPPGGPMGPPPNMISQPPPFGGPPGIPPPNMPPQDLWVETKSEDGKSYYYHVRTRETTWTRPQESPTCKVVTQPEVEAMAAAGQLPGAPGPQTMAMGPGMGGGGMPPMSGGPLGGPPPMGVMPNGMVMGQPPNVPPFMTPPPWVKDGNKDQKQDQDMSAVDGDEVPPGETGPSAQQNSQQNQGNMYGPGGLGPGGLGPGGVGPGGVGPGGVGPGGVGPSGVGPGGGPSGVGPGGVGSAPGGTPYGAWWGSQWPPHMVPHHQPNNMQDGGVAAQHQPATSAGNSQPMIQETIQLADTPPPQPGDKDEKTVIPREVAAAASQWSCHRSPEGRAYYYNSVTTESVWEKPQPLCQFEEYVAKIARENRDKGDKKRSENAEGKLEVIDVEAHAEAVAAAEAEAEAERNREVERQRLEKERQEKKEQEEKEKERQEKEKQEKEKAKQDRSKPISSTPISGTPWCVVWTGDGRVFFYNPTAHASVWERPAALANRADVDTAVSNPPLQLQQQQRKDSISTTTTATPTTNKSTNGELKRPAETESEDSDAADMAKKNKTDDNNPTMTKIPGQIDVGAAAAIEAEVRAARERGVVPHSARLRSFLAMLHEKQVSAFSTWEKELHKIVFDPRYLMLNSKERRQVFDQYVRDRAEEERKEKKNRLQQKKMAFRALMEEAKLHSKSSFSEFSSKHSREERFKAIEKSRDRELYFNEYIAELRKKEKEEKDRKRDQAKTDFIALLKEKQIDRHARYNDIKKKIDSDSRYKAVEGGALREDYFREYCKLAKDVSRKDKEQKERDRSSKKDKKEKDRENDKEKDKDSKKEKKKDKNHEKDPPTEEETSGLESEEAARKAARAQASIKEREREVQRALATSLRDRDKEREQHKRDEAGQHFNALLADLVRNPELTWREAKKQLKKDHRYALAELLSKEDKERLFSQHTATLSNKRRDKLRAVLTELNVSPTAHWKDVKPLLEADPNTPTYSSSKQMEREFREYQRSAGVAARTAFRHLLAETRTLSHRTRAAVQNDPGAKTALHNSLKEDARYLALDHIPEEREQIIESYLEELEKKGPPPPPTATEPSRRTKQ